MKIILINILIILSICSGCKTAKLTTSASENYSAPVTETTANFSEQSTWLLGYFNPVQMSRHPHSQWYIKGYDEYQFNPEPVNKLTGINKDDLTIKVVLGTWCPDSRREVPRFMRILDTWGFPVAKVTFIGVDNTKLAPVGEYDELSIERVPTFIFYKNNIEAGRIIENPLTSLEQDMVNILSRNE